MNRPQHADLDSILSAFLDGGSWRSWDRPAWQPAANEAYRRELVRAVERSGADESIRTGQGRVAGHRVAVVASEYGFLGGSVGGAAARRAVVAIERATAQRRVLVALPASGGTRMQEGTPAFLQMLAISGAIAAHRAAGLPYLVYLRHPTTGGVLASWASLGHVTFAEPGALVGFLGPRVVQALTGASPHRDAQSPEALHRAGIVDAVVAPADLREVVRRVLTVLTGGSGPSGEHTERDFRDAGTSGAAGRSDGRAAPPGDQLGRPDDPWAAVLATRAPDRPGFREFLTDCLDEVTLLGASELGENRTPGTPVITALALLQGIPCMVVGQDRVAQRHRPIGIPDLNAARRAVQRAADLSLPVLTVIDTPGAELSDDAERNGIATTIARCLAVLSTVPVPTVSMLLGQGAGGAALALLPADAVVAAQDAWLAPLPPEGASAIRYRSVDHAAAMARDQRITAGDLLGLGVVDLVVSIDDHLVGLAGAVARCLRAAVARDPAVRLSARRDRYRRLSMAEDRPAGDRPAGDQPAGDRPVRE